MFVCVCVRACVCVYVRRPMCVRACVISRYKQYVKCVTQANCNCKKN